MMTKGSLALIAAALMLTACVSSNEPRRAPPPAQPQGVEGTWADPNGIVSTFQAGTFNTRSTDTNALWPAAPTRSLRPRLWKSI